MILLVLSIAEQTKLSSQNMFWLYLVFDLTSSCTCFRNIMCHAHSIYVQLCTIQVNPAQTMEARFALPTFCMRKTASFTLSSCRCSEVRTGLYGDMPTCPNETTRPCSNSDPTQKLVYMDFKPLFVHCDALTQLKLLPLAFKI